MEDATKFSVYRSPIVAPGTASRSMRCGCMAKEPVQPQKPHVENSPEPAPAEDRPMVDPVPPEKDLPRMGEQGARGSMKAEQPSQPDGAPDQQPGAVRGTLPPCSARSALDCRCQIRSGTPIERLSSNAKRISPTRLACIIVVCTLPEGVLQRKSISTTSTHQQ